MWGSFKMIVKKIEYSNFKLDGFEQNAVFLTEGKEYLVLAIEYSCFRLFDDMGEPVLYPSSFFEIVDCSCEDWVKITDENGEIIHYGYKEFSDRYFFEDFFDDKEENVKVVLNFLKKYDKELAQKLIDVRFSANSAKNIVNIIKELK